MSASKLLAGILLFCLAAAGFADGTIQLSTLPNITVADGHSTVTVSAYVRRASGAFVPDGTQVEFSTNLGHFKDDSIVQTVNGVARVILQTDTIPGTATITATARGAGAITTTEIEFLSDRSLLSSANEYVEIVAPGYMMFSLDQRIIGAAGPDHGARLRYREIEIEADDLQLNIPTYEVRAKRARLKIGKFSHEFEELYIRLPARRGAGTTTLTPAAPIYATSFGRVAWIGKTHARFGLTAFNSQGLMPIDGPFEPLTFRFEDISESTSMIAAKKAVVFPHKEIQFQRAEVYVSGVKIMKLPLYEVSLNRATPVVTDSIFSVNNSQISINYPYYLSLKPGETSLIRFTTGNKYGRTSGVDNGISLDYELNWNRGDEFDGGLALTSFTNNNWGLSAHQYIRFDDRSTGTAFLDLPQGRSIFGSLNYSRQFEGFGINLNTSTTHSLRGSRFDSQQVSFVAEKDPIKMGKLPLRVTYGMNASGNASSSEFSKRSQSIYGVHVRTQLVPRKLDGVTQLNGYFSIAEQFGHNAVEGLAFAGNLSVSRQLGKYASGLLSYDYYENGFNSGLTGKHQVNFSGNYNQGNFGSTVSASRALDIDKFSLFADLGYHLSSLWRLSYSYTLDRFLGNSYVDYTAAIGYRIGFREIGLTFSGRTHRFGFQVLGTSFGG